jgi:hypothetical protein
VADYRAVLRVLPGWGQYLRYTSFLSLNPNPSHIFFNPKGVAPGDISIAIGETTLKNKPLRINFYLDTDTKYFLKRLAKEEQRTVSNLVKSLIRKEAIKKRILVVS